MLIQRLKGSLLVNCLCTDWPIHIGGCNYGYLWADEGTGHDVVGA